MKHDKIIKALKYCINSDCSRCKRDIPHLNVSECECIDVLMRNALDLIFNLQARIEEQNAIISQIENAGEDSEG